MVVVLREHRADEAQVIRDPSEMRDQLREVHPALPMSCELERRPQQYVLVAQLKNFDLLGVRLAAPLGKLRLVIEQVHLRRTAVLAQLNDRFRLADKMPFPRSERIRTGRDFRRSGGRQKPRPVEQTRQRHRAEAAADRLQEFPSSRMHGSFTPHTGIRWMTGACGRSRPGPSVAFSQWGSQPKRTPVPAHSETRRSLSVRSPSAVGRT